jgi:L-2-hydroxyglutarate oxidase LhgO
MMRIDKKVEVAVIGAGVIGLAAARLFAIQGKAVRVFEEADEIGTQTSARGSHVIHAGIYYPPGSLKARLCVQGRDLLYEYCKENNVEFKKLGKLIVATSDKETRVLTLLKDSAEKNGVMDLQWLTSKEVEQKEPAVKCVGALLSPSTGIVDAQGLMRSLAEDAQSHGTTIALHTSVIGGKTTDEGIVLFMRDQEKTYHVLCRNVINAAGLQSPAVARSIGGIRLEHIPKSYYAKGHYFTLTGPVPFNHLIYPVPVPGGLGIHATLNMRGEVRFGPDVFWQNHLDYTFEVGREKIFYEHIRKYYPTLEEGMLEPDNTGIRPKVVPEGSPDQDFIIQGKDMHGITGLVNLFGIESPGFTSSFAIAREIERML